MLGDYFVEKSPQGLMSVVLEIEKTLPNNPLIGVCGGSSIRPVLEAITLSLEGNPESKFANARFLMIDERLVSRDNPESNSKVIREALGLEQENAQHDFQLIEFNTQSPEEGVDVYTDLLASHGGSFDLIFLGVGEDSHIASLFPGFQWPTDISEAFFTFSGSPKPPSDRMSASPRTISSAKKIVLLFFGEGKRTAFERFLKSEETENECPVLMTKKAFSHIVIRDID
jgi:6-phosphogluconolactonase